MISLDRTIVHFDLDTFFVSVERLQDSSLKGKPVLIGGTGDRGVVASCSYEARGFGIHSAMSMKMARLLCPQAIIKRGDYEQYSNYSHHVTEIIRDHVPVYEKTSIDEFYVDLTGMDRFFGSYKLATDIRGKIMKETGLPISFALSTNKTVAKVGTGEAKPNGQKEIPGGTEKIFLAPLSVRKIPMVGEKTYTMLRSMGVEKVRTMQEMPVELMERLLGLNGISLWKKANGIDNSPVEPYNEQKSISTECTFDKDTIDISYLKNRLVQMTETLAYQLRRKTKLTSCVTVKIRYADFNTYTMQTRVPYTALDTILIGEVKNLFDKLYQKRMLIRLIGVKFSHLVEGNYQINLFDDTAAAVHLCQAMDHLRKRFGEGSVLRAAGLGIQSREFNPFNGIRK